MNWKSLLRRAVLAGAVTGGVSAWVVAEPAQTAPPVEMRADALQAEALKAIRQGEWSRTSELISKAAAVSDDPSLSKMSQWIAQFESQRQTFAAERGKQYDEAVTDVRKLIDSGHADFAIDAAARAYILADDKDKFHDESWVKDLIAQTVRQADQAEQANQWIKALRLYGDLAAIEPLNPQWKHHVKAVTRRMRVLAMYNPDMLKAMADAESKVRESADAVLKPTTQPTTKPTTTADSNESFKIDWKEQVKGIQMEMLRDALRDARRHYWRSVTYRDLLAGGLEGLRAVATTAGVEKAFPKVADETAREQFITALNEVLASINAAPSPNDDSLMTRTLSQLWQRNRETIGLPEEVFVNEFADGSFNRLDDFTGMIWPFDVEEFNKSTQGEFTGVGIQIDTNDGGELLVVGPLEDTPAYKLGIKDGDVVTHINGKNAKGITINQAVKNITGPAGTTVRLTVRSPDGESKTYDIRREVIKVASVKGWERKSGGSWNYFVDPEHRIGYVRLTNFTKGTTEELRAALAQMRLDNARAVILDLRYNPGGLLNAATEVSDRFLSGGDIVSTRSDRENSGPPPIVAGADADDVNIPMVVLVNQYSASASEIVSGALRDHKRALIVGERTFGKGSVQMLFQVDGRAAFLKLTTSHYYLPGGTCIHREDNSPTWGVEPDVTVTMTNEQMSKANKVRREQDVLRDQVAPSTQPVATAQDVLDVDPQLSAAVLLLRLQLAGAKI